MPNKTSEQEEFFIRITNPHAFRKNLLESSKEILHILKEVYTVSQMREAKHELISKISGEIKELKLLIQKIDELVPKYKNDDLKKFFPAIYLRKKAAAKPEKEEEPKPPPKKSFSDLEKISSTLNEVERRLESI
ncbi:hypothetical protein KY348_01130 [Candidatus Woesearchaeota archaeon]|nr:hypothetical protein [Candidatus Woesearchaeota archaeon]